MPPSAHPVDELLPLPKLFVLGRNSVLVVAISLGFGLIPIVSPNFFHIFLDALEPIFGDGIILTSIAAVLLNAFFNRTSREKAEVDRFLAARPLSTSDR